jgi:hypothetical protein
LVNACFINHMESISYTYLLFCAWPQSAMMCIEDIFKLPVLSDTWFQETFQKKFKKRFKTYHYIGYHSQRGGVVWTPYMPSQLTKNTCKTISRPHMKRFKGSLRNVLKRTTASDVTPNEREWSQGIKSSISYKVTREIWPCAGI